MLLLLSSTDLFKINFFKTFLHEDNQSVKWLDPDQDRSSGCSDLAGSKLFAKVISKRQIAKKELSRYFELSGLE